MNLPGQELLGGFLGGRAAQPGPSPEVSELRLFLAASLSSCYCSNSPAAGVSLCCSLCE